MLFTNNLGTTCFVSVWMCYVCYSWADHLLIVYTNHWSEGIHAMPWSHYTVWSCIAWDHKLDLQRVTALVFLHSEISKCGPRADHHRLNNWATVHSIKQTNINVIWTLLQYECNSMLDSISAPQDKYMHFWFCLSNRRFGGPRPLGSLLNRY